MVADSVFLGDMISTGKICPCSGWWVCAHEARVSGGRRRHMEKGATMPPVVVMLDVPWWRAWLPHRPTKLASTVWTIVEYDDPTETRPIPILEAYEFAEAA